jgi:hypothetical protein
MACAGCLSPLISRPISDHRLHSSARRPPIFYPLNLIMSTSKVQCHGCEKWFSARGLSQHVSKTQERRCQDAFSASRVQFMSSSNQHVATQPPPADARVWHGPSPICASPVSTGSSDREDDYAQRDQMLDVEIAVTRGAY